MKRNLLAAGAAALVLTSSSALADDQVTFSFWFKGAFTMEFGAPYCGDPPLRSCIVSVPTAGTLDLVEPFNIQSDTTVPDPATNLGSLRTIVDVENGILVRYTQIDDLSQTSYDYFSTLTLNQEGGTFDSSSYELNFGVTDSEHDAYFALPETSSSTMLLAGLGLLAFARRRQRI